VLSQGEPRDATANFDTYRILQRHRAVCLQLHDFLVYISDHSNAEITHSTHTTKIKKSHKSHGDHESGLENGCFLAFKKPLKPSKVRNLVFLGFTHSTQLVKFYTDHI